MPLVGVKVHSRHKGKHFGVENGRKFLAPITDGDMGNPDVIQDFEHKGDLAKRSAANIKHG